MKAVMISVTPKMCEKVASGDCTILVRKTRPKIETPFKCYIYCTQGDSLNYLKAFYQPKLKRFWIDNKAFGCNVGRANGKVIGYFVCDKITDISVVVRNCNEDYNHVYHNDECKGSCLTWKKLQEYGKGKTLYAWHVSDLVIYDKPKSLEMFPIGKIARDCGCGGYIVYDKILTSPPKSWQYVEEKENEK